MKKKMKKLVLNRETVADLDQTIEQKLGQVAGGAYTARCQYSGYATCLTCEATCTTNYC